MKLAIVGAGKMGGAVLTGALRAGVLEESEVGVYHPDEARRLQLASRYGVAPLNDEGIHRAERVLIAVKPQSFDSVAPLIANRKGSYISLMAGVSAATIARRVGSSRVVRAMPNLGARIGVSATALASLPQVSQEDLSMAQRLFAAVGTVYEVPEGLFDAFTGLAGSGPAFAAVFAEALADGGVRAGFDRKLAKELAQQVLLATAKLLETEHPAALKDEVASAGGTAIAGILQLEAHGFRYATMRAVEEASLRAAFLSKEES
ncbi:MAG: pyrroline-5-carboxylate reductase [Deinococcota bacterium]|jgi:pyrroline-5-carboxylate reductase|nr:pyrroline-5-carboxylate reductase [Deinococcota bacterium]